MRGTEEIEVKGLIYVSGTFIRKLEEQTVIGKLGVWGRGESMWILTFPSLLIDIDLYVFLVIDILIMYVYALRQGKLDSMGQLSTAM